MSQKFQMNSPTDFQRSNEGLADAAKQSQTNQNKQHESAAEFHATTKGSFGIQGANTQTATGEGYGALANMHGTHAEGSSEFLRGSLTAHEQGTQEQAGVARQSQATAESIQARVNK